MRVVAELAVAGAVALGCGGSSSQPPLVNRTSPASVVTTDDDAANAHDAALEDVVASQRARQIETDRRMLAVIDFRISVTLDELAAASSEADRDVAKAKLELLRNERQRIAADLARRATEDDVR